MRIATMVIALCLVMIIGLQSCAATMAGNISGHETLAQGGAVGVLVAFLFVLGAAFAMGVPRVSVVMFSIATAFALLAGSTTEFRDLTVWGFISLGLAVMSFYGGREKQRVAKTEAA